MVTATAAAGVEETRARIRSLPAEAQQELIGRWPLPKDRNLNSADLTGDELAAIVNVLDNVEQVHTRLPQETIERLIADLKTLPADLLAIVEKAAVDAGIPNLLTHRATQAHADLIDAWIEGARIEQKSRQDRIHGRCAELDLDEPASRHAIVRAATGGRVESSRHVTADEVAVVEQLCDAISVGTVTISWDAAGDIVLAGDIPAAATNRDEPPDWKAIAKQRGVTQAELLRRARTLAGEIGVEPPAKLAAITGQLLERLLAAPADEPAAASAQQPAAPDPQPEVMPTAVPVAAPTAGGPALVVVYSSDSITHVMVDSAVADKIRSVLAGAA